MTAETHEAPISAVAAAPGASDQYPNHHEGEPIMTIVQTPPSGSSATYCPFAWCDMGDGAGGHADFPGMHRKPFHRGPLRLDFIVDNEEDGGTYISWNDTIDITFELDDLGRLNAIAADLIVAKAAFEQFLEGVSK